MRTKMCSVFQREDGWLTGTERERDTAGRCLVSPGRELMKASPGYLIPHESLQQAAALGKLGRTDALNRNKHHTPRCLSLTFRHLGEITCLRGRTLSVNIFKVIFSQDISNTISSSSSHSCSFPSISPMHNIAHWVVVFIVGFRWTPLVENRDHFAPKC